MRHGNPNSIGRLIARELRAGNKLKEPDVTDSKALVERVARIIDPDAWHETLPTDGLGTYWIKRRIDARTKAEAALTASGLDEAIEGLTNAADMCAVYADFIRNHVAAEEIEVHPYLPALEDVIQSARTLSDKLKG